MSANMTLEVNKRAARGKGQNHRLRAQGLVPGVFYTKSENIPVQVPDLPMMKAFHQLGTSQLFMLKIEGDAPKPSLIKSVAMHPTRNKIVHVDFYGVDMSRKLKVMIPVELQGAAPGVKDGGILNLYRDHVEVECLPTDIPEKAIIDVSGLKMNDTVHIQDLTMAASVTAVFDENYAVCGVTPPAAEVEPGAEAEAAEAETEAQAQAQAEA